MSDEKNEEPISETEALTDEQLDEVSGAGGSASTPTADVDLLKPYPPWPGSP